MADNHFRSRFEPPDKRRKLNLNQGLTNNNNNPSVEDGWEDDDDGLFTKDHLEEFEFMASQAIDKSDSRIASTSRASSSGTGGLNPQAPGEFNPPAPPAGKLGISIQQELDRLKKELADYKQKVVNCLNVQPFCFHKCFKTC